MARGLVSASVIDKYKLRRRLKRLPDDIRKKVVRSMNTSGGTVNVCGWLDRPDDSPGSFSAADGFCQSTAASGTLNFTWANLPTDQSYNISLDEGEKETCDLNTGAAC